MNKEEIIIDGVNVKDCKRRFGKNSYCRYFKRLCAENNFNCIWKQHERLKEENERLKETEKEISDFISDVSTCGFRYDCRNPDNLDELQQCIEDLCNKFYNYKQTLQEIKAIAKGIRSYLEVPAPRDVRFEMDRILALITEIELPDQKESEER